jgi:hypothetical protein
MSLFDPEFLAIARKVTKARKIYLGARTRWNSGCGGFEEAIYQITFKRSDLKMGRARGVRADSPLVQPTGDNKIANAILFLANRGADTPHGVQEVADKLRSLEPGFYAWHRGSGMLARIREKKKK